MYRVMCINSDREKFMFANKDHLPLEFDDSVLAYAFIQNMMKEENHPRLMWVEEVEQDGNPGYFSDLTDPSALLRRGSAPGGQVSHSGPGSRTESP